MSNQTIEDTADGPLVERPRLTLDKNEKEEFERHHKELEQLIEQCSSKLNEIAELDCTQKFAKTANIEVPRYLDGGYGWQFREKLARFSEDLNGVKRDFLRDYKRLAEIETKTICQRCSCHTRHDLQECRCLKKRRHNNVPMGFRQGVRMCKACIKDLVESSSSAIANVCSVCATLGCRKDWNEGCGVEFEYALLNTSSEHRTYMCESCKSSYVVGSFRRGLPAAVFTAAKHRHSHKYDIARDHGGCLAKLDDNLLQTLFGYFNAATLCRFSQTNYTIFSLIQPVAKKLVEQARARNLIYSQSLFHYVGIWMKTLHLFESQTASQFGFDFANDMAGAAVFSRGENRACFTDGDITHQADWTGSLIYDNYIHGAVLEASAVCGNLPLSSNSGDYFLIATLHFMEEVSHFSFGLVPSDCCSEDLRTSPEDYWCANFTLPLRIGRVLKVILGMKYDSKANRLTYIFLCGETRDGDMSVFNRDPDCNSSVVQDTIVVVNPSPTEPLLWALRFESSDQFRHLVTVREATRDQFLQLQQKIRSYSDVLRIWVHDSLSQTHRNCKSLNYTYSNKPRFSGSYLPSLPSTMSRALEEDNTTMSTIQDPEDVKRAFEESEMQELKRHHAELDELIERCKSKLDMIAKLDGPQRLVQAENIIIPQHYLEAGYMSESKMKLDDFSHQVNVEKGSFLRDYERLRMIEATTVCHGCSKQTMNGLRECECLHGRSENNIPICLSRGLRLCETCIEGGTKVCSICAAIGCVQDSGRGCATTFALEARGALSDSLRPTKSMCASCKDNYVVGFSQSVRDLSSGAFQLASHRHVHKHSIATNHGGALAILDGNCLDTVFGYFNTATMCQFSQTNYTNYKLMNRFAKKFVDTEFAQELILAGESGSYTVIQKLQFVEKKAAIMFGFDFVDDMAAAVSFSRRENQARFTKIYDPIKDTRTHLDGPFIYNNFLDGNSAEFHNDDPVTASAICGNLPLSRGEEHFLIVTLDAMKEVGSFTFGLVSSGCCPKALASSPVNTFCTNFKLARIPDDADWCESRVILGIKFDSKANQLTHTFLQGESYFDEDTRCSHFIPKSVEKNWKVVRGTVGHC